MVIRDNLVIKARNVQPIFALNAIVTPSEVISKGRARTHLALLQWTPTLAETVI
jgi:hypothetical protein